MTSTLSLVKKQSPQQDNEREQDYEDRMIAEACLKLYGKPKRTVAEEQEFQELQRHWVAIQISQGGHLPSAFADKDLRESAARLQRELAAQFGGKNALKTLLIDRLVFAWNMAVSFETQFLIGKYKKAEDGSVSLSYNETSIKFLREVRKGIESANDQIIRLAQTLQNLSAPPIQVRANNAFFAQNQQVNQAASPKDLERTSDPLDHAASAR